MKKIVPRLLIISSQILVGALFLIITLSNTKENNLEVNSKDFNKLSEFVYNDEEIIVLPEEEVVQEEVIEEEIKENIIETKQEQQEETKVETIDNYFMTKEVINTYVGKLTGYGPDCYGCGNFNTNMVKTASGYHIANIVDGVIEPAFVTTYTDSEFGEVRIVAADKTIPYYSIVRITIPNNDPIIAIVLDRGSTVGITDCSSTRGCLTMFDLLFATESQAISMTEGVKFEILRMGQ